MAPEYLEPLAKLYWPGASHSFLGPVAGAVQAAAQSDQIIAWSLGAWRVLDFAAAGGVVAGRVLLLAPFVGFCTEDRLGGRVSRTKVHWLRRWVERDRDPGAALEDFRRRAGLAPSPASAASAAPYGRADLLEGLDKLAAPASPALREFAAGGLPPHWRGLVGEADPLLDAATVCRNLPGCALVAGASHEPVSLLNSIQGGLDAI